MLLKWLSARRGYYPSVLVSHNSKHNKKKNSTNTQNVKDISAHNIHSEKYNVILYSEKFFIE